MITSRMYPDSSEGTNCVITADSVEGCSVEEVQREMFHWLWEEYNRHDRDWSQFLGRVIVLVVPGHTLGAQVAEVLIDVIDKMYPPEGETASPVEIIARPVSPTGSRFEVVWSRGQVHEVGSSLPEEGHPPRDLLEPDGDTSADGHDQISATVSG